MVGSASTSIVASQGPLAQCHAPPREQRLRQPRIIGVLRGRRTAHRLGSGLACVLVHPSTATRSSVTRALAVAPSVTLRSVAEGSSGAPARGWPPGVKPFRVHRCPLPDGRPWPISDRGHRSSQPGVHQDLVWYPGPARRSVETGGLGIWTMVQSQGAWYAWFPGSRARSKPAGTAFSPRTHLLRRTSRVPHVSTVPQDPSWASSLFNAGRRASNEVVEQQRGTPRPQAPGRELRPERRRGPCSDRVHQFLERDGSIE